MRYLTLAELLDMGRVLGPVLRLAVAYRVHPPRIR